MSVIGDFLRRLLVQALVSSTVMAGIQVVVRFGPDILPWPSEIADGNRSPAAGDTRTGAGVLSIEPAFARGFAQDRTQVDVKAGRFAAWRERDVAAPTIPPARLVSKGMSTGLSDVMLFDQCRPSCESRDPLLAFNQPRSALQEPNSAPPKNPPSPSVADATEVGTGGDAPGVASGVAAAARGSVSWARRLVGTAGDALPW